MNHTKESQARTLQELSPGESGMIVSVGNQSGAVKRRLVDMGLTPGTVVKVTKIAPLGDPLEVSLRGYELSRLSKSPRTFPTACKMPLLSRRCAAEKSSLRSLNALPSKAFRAFDPTRGGLPPSSSPPTLGRIRLDRVFSTTTASSRFGRTPVFRRKNSEKPSALG